MAKRDKVYPRFFYGYEYYSTPPKRVGEYNTTVPHFMGMRSVYGDGVVFRFKKDRDNWIADNKDVRIKCTLREMRKFYCGDSAQEWKHRLMRLMAEIDKR